MALTNREILPKITRKTMLYKSGVEYAGYALNHAEGGAHGCNFPCYAMMRISPLGIFGTSFELSQVAEWAM